MVDLKLIIASNIIKLRMDAGMTQSELAEKLNYSDKSVSKWERAESLPDAKVLKSIGEIFGVSMDYIFNSHDEWQSQSPKKKDEEENKKHFNLKAVQGIAICGIWTFALFIFILFWITLNSFFWIVFFAALPISVLTHLILNSIWNQGRNNILIITLLIFSILLLIYISLIKFNIWQIFLLMLPVSVILYLSSKIKKNRNSL